MKSASAGFRISPARLVLCALATSYLNPSPAADTAESAETGAGNLEEVIVTATKRPETISRVPISIQAYSEQALAQSGIKSVSDLAAFTPGVEFDTAGSYGSGTLINIAIRGVNSTIGASPVGMYIDETPIQTRVSGVSFFGNPLPLLFDVARVEVDRGPQGTLFGAGAEGGAIRFIGADPDVRTYSGIGRAEGAYTEFGAPSFETGAAWGGPLVQDVLGFRVSAWYRDDGGFTNRIDPFTGADVAPNDNRQHSAVIRAALAYKPNDELTLSPTITWQQVSSNSQTLFWGEFSDPSKGELNYGNLLSQPSYDRFVLPSLKITANLGNLSFTSVSSYFTRDAHVLSDNTSYTGALWGSFGFSYGNPKGPEYAASYADAAPAPSSTSVRQISQELRLASNDVDARLAWTAGLFFSRNTQTDVNPSYSPFIAVNVLGLPADTCIYCASITSIDKQFAAFGQLDYRLLDPLSLTVGARVARTQYNYHSTQTGPGADPTNPTGEGVEKETPFTPRVSLTYRIDDGNMVYVSAGKGYRVGGYNTPIPIQSPELPTGCPLPRAPGAYTSDYLWSYEVGAKNKLWNGRISLASSAYHIDWRNIQQNIYLASCLFGFIGNTGSASVNGFDVNVQTALTEHFTLATSAAYTKTRITRDVSVNGFPVVQAGDVIGTVPQVTPPWDLTASARYEHELATGYRAYARVEDVFHSRNPGPFSSQIPASQVYAPLLNANPSTNLLNLRLGFQKSDWDVSFFINNVLNRIPELGQTQPGTQSRQFLYTTFRPRTLGLTATYRLLGK